MCTGQFQKRFSLVVVKVMLAEVWALQKKKQKKQKNLREEIIGKESWFALLIWIWEEETWMEKLSLWNPKEELLEST